MIGVDLPFGFFREVDLQDRRGEGLRTGPDDADGKLPPGKEGLNEDGLAEGLQQGEAYLSSSARSAIFEAAVTPFPVPSAIGLAKSGKGR